MTPGHGSKSESVSPQTSDSIQPLKEVDQKMRGAPGPPKWDPIGFDPQPGETKGKLSLKEAGDRSSSWVSLGLP